MTPEEHLAGSELGISVYQRVADLVQPLGDVEVRVSKSQIAFRRRRGFAHIWLPGRYLARPHAEVVLSIALPRRVPSARFKEIAHPTPTIWQHHLEIATPDDLDDQVRAWLEEAHASAG